MSFNVEEFKSKLNDLNSIAPTSKFDVYINPKSTELLDMKPNEYIRFLAFSVDLPGVSFSPDLVMLNGHGRVNEIPLRPAMSDCDIQFYMDSNSAAYKFFYNWMNTVSKFDGTRYKVFNNGFDQMEYASEYYADVHIHYKNNHNAKVMDIHLMEAYPLELSGMNLDWNNENILASSQIRLGFRAMKNSFL